MGVQNFNNTTPAAPTGAAQVLFQSDAGNPTRNDSAYIPAAGASTPGVIVLDGDLGGTGPLPEVVATHLSAPLPIAQGGTGNANGYADGMQSTITPAAAAGPIGVKTGRVIITAGSAIVLTLAAPVAGADDGKELTIQAATAYGHSVVSESGSPATPYFNGDKSTALFGGHLGDCLKLVAYDGLWLVDPCVNITLS